VKTGEEYYESSKRYRNGKAIINDIEIEGPITDEKCPKHGNFLILLKKRFILLCLL